MANNIISMREIQRNYKKLIEEARKEKKPIFLGSYGKPKAVLLDVDEFEKLKLKAEKQKKRLSWSQIKLTLDELSQKGLQGVSLSEFVKHDRQTH